MAVKSVNQILRELHKVQNDLLSKKTLEWYLRQVRIITADSIRDDGTRPPTQKILETGHWSSIRPIDFKNHILRTYQGFNTNILGRMIMFRYDPKHKDTLPYYDEFPLVIPFIPERGASTNTDLNHSMLGLNLHYLPHAERAMLLKALMTLINNTKRMDEKTQLKMKYTFLRDASRFRLFKPCIKRYLLGHVKSRIFQVNPSEWSRVIHLPIARWRKATEDVVWKDSLKMIRKAK